MTCLDENFLLDFVRGHVSAVQRLTLIEHITVCSECRDFVAEVLRSWPGDAPEPRTAAPSAEEEDDA